MTPDDGELRRRFRPLFEPRSIAIVGASNRGRTRANDVLDFTRAQTKIGHPLKVNAGRRREVASQ